MLKTPADDATDPTHLELLAALAALGFLPLQALDDRRGVGGGVLSVGRRCLGGGKLFAQARVGGARVGGAAARTRTGARLRLDRVVDRLHLALDSQEGLHRLRCRTGVVGQGLRDLDGRSGRRSNVTQCESA